MASREEIESRIRDQRTAEANRKGLIGQGGKIGTVLKALGSSVVGQTEDVAYLNISGSESEQTGSVLKDMPMMDIEGSERPSGSEWGEAADAVHFSTRVVGRHFDGLGRGMHLEIFYKDESSEMSVYHRGYLVYQEVQGELTCYVPIDEWEEWISSLFKVAKKIQREAKEKEFAEKVSNAAEAKKSWLREIASRWGIT
jgi:hypothetical protein